MSIRNDCDYLMLSAAVRARENKLLTQKRREQLLEAKDMEASTRILSDCGYGELERADAQSVEKLIDCKRAEMYSFLHTMMGDHAILQYFTLRYDYHNAKVLLKGGEERLLLPLGRISKEKLTDAFARNDFRALPHTFAAAVENARTVLHESKDAHQADLLLDAAMFAEKRELSAESEILKRYCAMEIDLYNFRAAVRLRRMGAETEQIRPLMISGGTVNPNTITATQGSAWEELARGSLLDAVGKEAAKAAAGEGLTAFECACDDALPALLENSRNKAFGEEIVIAYIAACEAEFTAVRTILLGQLSGIPVSELRARLRRAYC